MAVTAERASVRSATQQLLTGIVKIPDGVLGPKHGEVGIDLVADDCEPEPRFY